LKWIKANNKRRVTQRALKTLESAGDKQETDAFTDQQQLFNEVEVEKFVLTFL